MQFASAFFALFFRRLKKKTTDSYGILSRVGRGALRHQDHGYSGIRRGEVKNPMNYLRSRSAQLTIVSVILIRGIFSYSNACYVSRPFERTSIFDRRWIDIMCLLFFFSSRYLFQFPLPRFVSSVSLVSRLVEDRHVGWQTEAGTVPTEEWEKHREKKKREYIQWRCAYAVGCFIFTRRQNNRVSKNTSRYI